MQDAWLIGGAVAAGLGAGAAFILVMRSRKAARRQAEEPHAELEFEVVPDAPTTVPVRHLDPAPPPPPARQPLLVAVPAARGPMPLPPILRESRATAPPPPADPIPTEWARRQVGPAEPGRTKGACSGCGAMLSVSNVRPLKIACPVCGRTRLLS